MADTQEDKPEEIEARMGLALKRALATKPAPRKPDLRKAISAARAESKQRTPGQ